MRPLELRLRNFRSYFSTEQTFDFRGRRLVGIVGPIGSGKSSILDAISFALYGKTPTIGHRTKALIHQRADDGAVAFRFEVDGEVWEAVRVLRRGGASQHHLYRMASDDADAAITERVLQETEVNARVAQLLGLEFDAFSRSVLLAQGRFAEFLTAQPAERDRVLKGLFGYARIDLMREIARSHNREAEVEAEKLGIRVEQLVELGEQLDAEKTQRDEAIGRLELLTEAEHGVIELTAEADELGAQAAQFAKRADELDELAHRLPDPASSADLLQKGEAAAARRRTLGESLTAAEERLARAKEHMEQVEATGGRAAIAEAAAMVTELRSLDEKEADVTERIASLVLRAAAAAAEHAAAEAAVAAAVAAVETATTQLQSADAAVAAAEAALHEARHANMAMELRLGLAAGDRCPVCEQHVEEVPAAVADDSVERAMSALADSRATRDENGRERLEAAAREAASRAALESSTAGLAELAARRVAEEERVPALQQARADVTGKVAEILGPGDHTELLAEMKRRHDEAAAAVTAEAGAVEKARLDLDEGIAAQQRTDALLADLRVQLVDTAARLDADIDVGDSPQAIATALDAIRDRWKRERAELRERIASTEERTATVTAKRHDLLAALGVDGDFAAALAAARERVELHGASVARIEARIADSDEIRAAMAEQVARRDTFNRLASDLTDAKFVRYLLDEERSRLSTLGSDHFQRLSSGRYRFDDEGSFDIVDLTAAEAVRKADSLSGGETFLASLGLALALAEMVTRTGGRLDAFFLDEGFGTLDPEHLDLAMEGIEALVSDGEDRLVVVVSHVPELRHRFDDLIVLDRDPITGDTRVVAR